MKTPATRTRGEDIFIAVKNTCMRKGADLKNLRDICTDGAPAMTDNTQGFVARFSEYEAKECDNKQLIEPSLYNSPGSNVWPICCFKCRF